MTFTKGIDTSTHQDASTTPLRIDWSKPQLYEVKFVINRVTFCASKDDDFDYNWTQQRGRYLRGAYGFWGYWPGAPAVDLQARAVVNALKPDPGEMPVVWADVEKANDAYRELPPAAQSLPVLERYMKGIEDGLGMGTGLYTNIAGLIRLSPIPNWLLNKPLWIAWPLSPATGETVEAYIERTQVRPPIAKYWPKPFLAWQYSWKGPGLAMGMESHGLDMNYYNGDEPALRAWCGLSAPTTPDPGKDEPAMYENNFIIASNYNNQDAVASPVMDFAALAGQGVEGFALRLDNSYAANYAKARATGRAVFGVWRHRWQWDHDYVNSDSSVPFRDRAKVSFAEIRGIVTTNVPDAFIIVVENKDECTPVNLWKTFRHVCEALWEKYRVPVMVSTSKAFINASFAGPGDNYFTGWLSRENPNKANARFPFVCVNWRNEATAPATLYIPNPITNVKDAAKALPALAPTEDAEMKAGNSDWYGWEFGRTTHPAVTGGTLRLILLKDTPADVWQYLWGKAYPGPYAGGTTPPPTDPGTTPGETEGKDLAELRSMVEALTGRVTELERWRKS